MATCACMGPQGNDPLCPCAMRRAGLTPSNQWTDAKILELETTLKDLLKEREDVKGSSME